MATTAGGVTARSPADILVRQMAPDDVEAGVEVLVRAFNELNVSVGLPALFSTFSQARSTLQMALQLDRLGSWVAVWNERKVVGVAVTYRRGAYVSIGPVAVHPIAQGQGVGRMLMRQVADANADADCLALIHAGVNPHAFALYRTQGFRVVYAEANLGGRPVRVPARPEGIRQATRTDLDHIVGLDRRLAGIDRSRELELLLGIGAAFVAADGYLVTVRLGETRGLGPGASTDAATMRALIAAAAQDAPAGGLSARVPANGAAFDALFEVGILPEGVGNMMAAGRFPERSGEHVHPIFPEVL